MTKALREGVIVGLMNPTILIAKDGTELAIDDSASPIRCKDGQIVGCVLIFRDMTEQRQAEAALRESEQRFRVLFDLGPVAIFSCDREGVVQNYNRRAGGVGRKTAANQKKLVSTATWSSRWTSMPS